MLVCWMSVAANTEGVLKTTVASQLCCLLIGMRFCSQTSMHVRQGCLSFQRVLRSLYSSFDGLVVYARRLLIFLMNSITLLQWRRSWGLLCLPCWLGACLRIGAGYTIIAYCHRCWLQSILLVQPYLEIFISTMLYPRSVVSWTTLSDRKPRMKSKDNKWILLVCVPTTIINEPIRFKPPSHTCQVDSFLTWVLWISSIKALSSNRICPYPNSTLAFSDGVSWKQGWNYVLSQPM